MIGKGICCPDDSFLLSLVKIIADSYLNYKKYINDIELLRNVSLKRSFRARKVLGGYFQQNVSKNSNH